MRNLILIIIAICALLPSCAKKYYVNEAGSIRPVKQNVFSYRKRFKSYLPLVDTNAVDINQWSYQSATGSTNVFEYLRFFSTGQVLYFGFDTTLNLTIAHDLKKGIIGRYYFKKNQLRIQLFYPVSISTTLAKTYGFVKEGNIYTYNATPETWYGSYKLTKAFGKSKIREWKKHPITFALNQYPDW